MKATEVSFLYFYLWRKVPQVVILMSNHSNKKQYLDFFLVTLSLDNLFCFSCGILINNSLKLILKA